MTTKCFWCGATNDKSSDCCSICGRKLQWSNFFKAMLRPSVSHLVEQEVLDTDMDIRPTPTPIAVG